MRSVEREGETAEIAVRGRLDGSHLHTFEPEVLGRGEAVEAVEEGEPTFLLERCERGPLIRRLLQRPHVLPVEPAESRLKRRLDMDRRDRDFDCPA